VASDAVISMCGHLFCWPCLHQWLETRWDRGCQMVCFQTKNPNFDKIWKAYE
jgi:hypothetical protein